MRMTAGQYNKAVDEIRRLGILPGDGIQLGRYSAGTAVSVSQGTVKRRSGSRRSTTALNGWRSWNAIVTARVDYAGGGGFGGASRKLLEWRHAVKDGNSFRIARTTEAESVDVSDTPGTVDIRPIPQYGLALNLPDLTLQWPVASPGAGDAWDYWATSQWNPWTPIAGDVIRVYANRDVIISGLEYGFACCEYKPIRSEKIFVTWCKYVSAAYVRPELYWLNRSLIGEPDVDGIVTSSATIYEGTSVAGKPRQSGLGSGVIGMGGFSTQMNLHTGNDATWGYRQVAASMSYASPGVAYDASGRAVVAWYDLLAGSYKLKLAVWNQTLGGFDVTLIDNTASTAFYVQHVACDSAGVVHVLARNASTGAYRYVTSAGVAEVPTTTTSPCALAISPSGVPTILGNDSAGVWGFMQRIRGAWVTTALAAATFPTPDYANDLVFANNGDLYYTTLVPPNAARGLHIGVYSGGVDTWTNRFAPSGSYDNNSRTRLAMDARGYPVVAVSRLVSGNNYECDLWIWKRDGINDTYQSETLGNPYQLGGVHVVNGRGYNQ